MDFLYTGALFFLPVYVQVGVTHLSQSWMAHVNWVNYL